MKRVFGERGGLEQFRGGEGGCDEIGDCETFVSRREIGQQFGGTAEQAGGWTEALAVDAVRGFAMVVL